MHIYFRAGAKGGDMPSRRGRRIAVVLPIIAAGPAWLGIFSGPETTAESAQPTQR